VREELAEEDSLRFVAVLAVERCSSLLLGDWWLPVNWIHNSLLLLVIPVIPLTMSVYLKNTPSHCKPDKN